MAPCFAQFIHRIPLTTYTFVICHIYPSGLKLLSFSSNLISQWVPLILWQQQSTKGGWSLKCVLVI